VTILLYSILDVFTAIFNTSRGEAKRMLVAGALYQWQDGVDKYRIPVDMAYMELVSGDVLQMGKRRFVRMVESSNYETGNQ